MIDFAPFLDAPLAIQIHAIAALEVFLLGPVMLSGPKLRRLHKPLGYIWAANMVIAAGSSFFISELKMLGPFSAIHVLSVCAIIFLYRAIQHARNRNFVAHRGIMRGLYFGGVVTAGVFTFMPGRVMNRMAFGGESMTGFILICVLAAFWGGYVFLRPMIGSKLAIGE